MSEAAISLNDREAIKLKAQPASFVKSVVGGIAVIFTLTVVGTLFVAFQAWMETS